MNNKTPTIFNSKPSCLPKKNIIAIIIKYQVRTKYENLRLSLPRQVKRTPTETTNDVQMTIQLG